MAKVSNDSLAHGQQRPGGRTEVVRQVVAASVLALLREGRIDFTYNELADVSGVNKTTLYRRWPQRTDLIREAITEHNSTFKISKGKTWAETAEALVRDLAAFLSKPAEIAINVALFSDPALETNNLMFELWEPIQTKLNELVKDAQASGELPKSIDPSALISMLVSPLLVMTLIERKPINKKMLSQQIQIVKLMRFPTA